MMWLLNRGKAFRFFSKSNLVAIALAASLGVSPSVFGQGDDDGGVGSMFNDLPPSFLDNSIANNTADMASCFLGRLGAAAGALANPGMLGGGGGFNTVGQTLGGSWTGATCGEPGEINRAPSCSDVRDGTHFSPSKLAALRTGYETARDALACQKGKMGALQNEISCLQRQAATLNQQIGSMQNAFSQNMNGMKDYVGRLSEHIEGRESQKIDVDRFLNGDGSTGRQGLLQLEQETEAMLNQEIPDKIQTIEEGFRQIREQERSLEEMIQSRTAGLANECFTQRAQSNFICAKRDDPATPINEAAPTNAKEYLLCRFEQEQFRTSAGTVDLEDAGRRRRASERRSQLDAILTQILGDSPNQSALPSGSSPEQLAQASEQFANQPINLLSIADLESQYGGQLRGMSDSGVDVYGFVMGTMGSCFKRAEQQVRRERRRESSQLGRFQAGLKRQRRAANNEANKALNDFSQRYGRVVRALSGMNVPLDVNSCRNARPEVKVNCLREVETNFRGLLNGTSDNSGFVLQVRGDSSVPGFPVPCNGLKGCIADMQRIKQNLDVHIQALNRKKTEEIRAFNTAVDSTTNQIAAQFSIQSQQLDTRLQEMNAMLASLGITPGVEISRVESCPLEPESDPALGGLFKAPTNMACLIGGRMNPPMLNFAEDNFATALSGIAERSRETDTKMGDVTSGMRVLAGLAQSCGQEELDREVQEFRRLVTQWNSSNCGYSREHCDPNSSNSSLHSLNETVSGLSSGGSSGGDEIYALNSGVRGLCSGYEMHRIESANRETNTEARTTAEAARRTADTRRTEIERNVTAVDTDITRLVSEISALSGTDRTGNIPGVSPARRCNSTSYSVVAGTHPVPTATGASMPSASSVRSSCMGTGDRPPQQYCPARYRSYLENVRACMDGAKIAMEQHRDRAVADVASAQGDLDAHPAAATGRTGERHSPNSGTCSGLSEDMEGRAARIRSIQENMGEGAGGAL